MPHISTTRFSTSLHCVSILLQLRLYAELFSPGPSFQAETDSVNWGFIHAVVCSSPYRSMA